MEIYTVASGDTVSSIAYRFGLPVSQILLDNGISDPFQPVVGQALLLRFPTRVHQVRPGETLSSISRRYGLSQRQLWRNNPILRGGTILYPDQTIVLAYQEEGTRPLTVNGYAYPNIDPDLLRQTLPFLTWLTPFTYGFTAEGRLVEPEDTGMVSLAQAQGVKSMLHLSTLTPEGGFSNELSHLLFQEEALQAALISALETELRRKGYQGIDVDFEYVPAEDATAYAAFLTKLHDYFHPRGILVAAALAPKTSADQPGLLYEGHDYAAIGAAVDAVLLMTYEWGYAYSAPMAVAPLPNVRRVVEYALTEIPAAKLWLGLPTYGYDWPLPYEQGVTRATSLSPQQALELARTYGAAIEFDETAQAPWFRYTDNIGREHEVWFEDVRSMLAKFSLIAEHALPGVGYWNLMRPFPANWPLLDSQFRILPE